MVSRQNWQERNFGHERGLGLLPDPVLDVDAGTAAGVKKPAPQHREPGFLKILVGGAEFESATPWMSTKYSNQLN
jgi:hypothetical protein